MWRQGEVWQMKPMSSIVGYHFAQPSVDNKWDRCPLDVAHGVDGAEPTKATIEFRKISRAESIHVACNARLSPKSEERHLNMNATK